MKRYQTVPLTDALITILEAYSVDRTQAEQLVNTLLMADMRGTHSHGLSVLPAYINRIKQGGFLLSGECRIVHRTDSFCIVDAEGQLGMISAAFCMQLAVAECRRSGIYTVFCRNANTFGAASAYVKMATDQRMIGFCMSNSPSAMPASGGTRKILGTNPFAVGIPAKEQAPIIVDMATSTVAKSRINEIRKSGGTIPEGWAVDASGQPTTDPQAAIDGMVLPMAGHKGYAIALVIDILAGLLSGAAYLDHVNRFYDSQPTCMNTGQCFVAIDPTQIYGESFFEAVDDYILELKQSGQEVRYPGERAEACLKLCADKGVELPDETAQALHGLLHEHALSDALVPFA
ncbi:MAG: Ldh family oxidoreductase [Clostridia bacterium]|nr:Ldh family oxidoreductase [Clostridia bacterium]